MPLLVVAAAAAAVALAGCSHRPGADVPRTDDGTTEVSFESHLPAALRISRVVAVMDGQVIYNGDAARISLFRAKLPEGDHTIHILVRVDAPCGLAPEPHGTLVIKDTRSFDVGSTGGLVHLDAFAREPWRHEEERVELRVTLRGMRPERSLATSSGGASADAIRACADQVDVGGGGKEQRTRCMVRKLVEHYRAQRDIIALSCNVNKLHAIDQALKALPTTDGPARTALEVRIEQLGREAEECVGQELAYFGGQQVTWEGCDNNAYGGDPRTSLQ